MDKINFLVQGSSEAPYSVKFVRRTDSNLSAYCNCPAGQNGLFCKHRIRILEGNPEGIVSNNFKDVETIKSWIFGTDIEKTMNEVKSLEAKLQATKEQLSKAKKELAMAMRD